MKACAVFDRITLVLCILNLFVAIFVDHNFSSACGWSVAILGYIQLIGRSYVGRR